MKILVVLFSLPAFAYSHIHTVKVKLDQIVLVRTALGIATIIETPDTIQSAIIGDQSGFKVEYLNRAVTIKPIRPGARTNLYLQTMERRYDLRLETEGQANADYIIYLKTYHRRKATHWRNVSKSVSGNGLTLKCRRIARLPSGYVLVDLLLYSKKKIKISPDEIWLKQGSSSRVIDGLFLSNTEIVGHHPIMIGLTLSNSDLIVNRAVLIALKANHETLQLPLPKDILWK